MRGANALYHARHTLEQWRTCEASRYVPRAKRTSGSCNGCDAMIRRGGEADRELKEGVMRNQALIFIWKAHVEEKREFKGRPSLSHLKV